MNALLLVDLQVDFAPGGALPVPDGDEVVRVANDLMSCFDVVVATQDWHPANHGSFAANHPTGKPGDLVDLEGLPQILWPVHCVQNTRGADFITGLRSQDFAHVSRKGMDPRVDSYSGFFDNGHRKATDLGKWLTDRGVDTLFVMGLATDYCVRATVVDALKMGFHVHVITDGCRGIDLHPGDIARAYEEMTNHGARLTTRDEVLAAFGSGV